MAVRVLTTAQELKHYDVWVKAHPHGTLWQSLERKQYFDALQKEVRIYTDETDGITASAMVVIDRTALGLCVWDIPRGPVGDDCTALLHAIIADARKEKCMALYASPVIPHTLQGAHASPRHIHCEATLMLDIGKSEEDILAGMKPKGRYNIRVAEKNGITAEQSEDIEAFHALVTQTGGRDGFMPLSLSKYRAFLQHLPGSFLLLAYAQAESGERVANSKASVCSPLPAFRKPIAGLMGVQWNGIGTYYYGASSYAHRALMAPYALQWAAMRYCKERGCTHYDLLGVAPADAPKDHAWAGITRFKEQFGGELHTYPAEQELILRPFAKTLLDLKRRFIR